MDKSKKLPGPRKILKAIPDLSQIEETFLPAFMDNSPIIAWIKDAGDLTWLYVNRQFEHVFKRTCQEVVGKTDFDLWPEFVAGPLHQNDLKTLSSNETSQIYETIALPDGQLRHWLAFRFPLKLLSGKLYLGGLLVDITQGKLTEAKALFQSYLVDNANDAIIALDQEDRVLSWNKAATEMYGWTSEEVLGRFVYDFIRQEYEDITDDEVTRQIWEEGGWKGELIQFRRNGEKFPVQATVSPVTDAEGRRVGFVAINRDITEIKRVEFELQTSESRYHTLFNNTPIGLYRTTPDGKILDANPALIAIFGCPDRETFLNTNSVTLYDDPQERENEKDLLEKKGVVRDVQIKMRRFDGSMIWMKDTCRIVKDPVDHTFFYEGSLEDITELKRTEDVLKELAIRDELTGLYNRREMMRILSEEFERYWRHGRKFSLVLLDIDHFKEVNDRYGHLSGDNVLRTLGQLIQGNLRFLDKSARYGGDEFALILPETSEVDAFLLAERLRQKISAHSFVISENRDSIHINITVTIGAGEITDDITTRESLIVVVDKMMYIGKRQGRNRTISNDTSLPPNEMGNLEGS